MPFAPFIAGLAYGLAAAAAPPYGPPPYAYMPPPAYLAPAPLALPPYSPTVEWAQWALNGVAHAGLEQDGIAGPATVAAVMEFQRENRLQPDGYLGAATVEVLKHWLDAAAAPPAPRA